MCVSQNCLKNCIKIDSNHPKIASNGGIYAALHRSGELSRLASAGVRHVLVYSVDNALARVADPETVGAMAANAAQAGGKAVARAGPGEKVCGWGCAHSMRGIAAVRMV
jgi:UDP-N-acetylglucosamine pyrophosphorylase